MIPFFRHVYASFLFAPLSLVIAGPFGEGNVVVLQAGNSESGLSPVGDPASLVELSPDGTFVQTIPLDVHIPGSLNLYFEEPERTGMRITSDSDGHGLTVTGFVPPFGGSPDQPLSYRSFFEARPAILRINAEGQVSSPRTHMLFQGILGAISHGGESWVGINNNPGLIHISADDDISGLHLGVTRPRFVDGMSGIAIGNPGNNAGISYMPGLPRTDTPRITVVSDSVVMTDFFLSMEKGVAYLSTTTGTVRRYELGNGGFSLSRIFTTGSSARLNGLTANLDADVPVLYAVSDSKLYRLEDDGIATQMEAIATAEVNYAFVGVQSAPTLEPLPPPPPADRTPPALVLGGKSRSAVIRTSLNHVRLSGAVVDGGGAAAVQMRIRKRGGWKSIAVVDGMWTRQVKLRGEKKLRVKIRATDASGNVAVASRLIRRK